MIEFDETDDEVFVTTSIQIEEDEENFEADYETNIISFKKDNKLISLRGGHITTHLQPNSVKVIATLSLKDVELEFTKDKHNHYTFAAVRGKEIWDRLVANGWMLADSKAFKTEKLIGLRDKQGIQTEAQRERQELAQRVKKRGLSLS